MEHLEILLDWLGGFPLWQGAAIDTTGPEMGCGLFPQGTRLISRREDVLGNALCRWQQVYLLRRLAPRDARAAAWLMEFAQWVRTQAPPAVGLRTAVRAEKGRLVRGEAADTATFEISIILEFEEETQWEELTENT